MYKKLEDLQSSLLFSGINKYGDDSGCSLDVVDTETTGVGDVSLFLGGADVVELDLIVVALLAESHGLVDLDVLGELAVGLQIPGLVRRVLENDVGLGVLVVSQTDEDDVGLIDPDLLTEFASDVAETFDPVEAHGLETAVAEHLGDLGVLLAVLFEDELALQAFVFVLATTAIFASLSLVLGHGGSFSNGID